MSGGDRQNDNSFNWEKVCSNVEEGLIKGGFKRVVEYEIMIIPNTVNITNGRGRAYVFE